MKSLLFVASLMAALAPAATAPTTRRVAVSNRAYPREAV